MGRIDTVLLALLDKDLRRQVSEALEREEAIEILGVVDDSTETVQSALTSAPTVVIVEAAPGTAWVEVCTYLSLVSPSSWVILLAPEGVTREVVDTAMLLGVRQVLPSPEGVICIPDVVERLRHVKEKRDSREFVMAADPLKHRPTFRRQAAREHDTGRWPDSHGVVPGRTASRRR